MNSDLNLAGHTVLLGLTTLAHTVAAIVPERAALGVFICKTAIQMLDSNPSGRSHKDHTNSNKIFLNHQLVPAYCVDTSSITQEDRMAMKDVSILANLTR